MDFEKSVLTELRETVEEVDPIDWLLSLAHSDSAGFSAGSAASGSNNNNSKSGPAKPAAKQPMNDWDSITDVLGTLAEIEKM